MAVAYLYEDWALHLSRYNSSLFIYLLIFHWNSVNMSPSLSWQIKERFFHAFIILYLFGFKSATVLYNELLNKLACSRHTRKYIWPYSEKHARHNFAYLLTLNLARGSVKAGSVEWPSQWAIRWWLVWGQLSKQRGGGEGGGEVVLYWHLHLVRLGHL